MKFERIRKTADLVALKIFNGHMTNSVKRGTLKKSSKTTKTARFSFADRKQTVSTRKISMSVNISDFDIFGNHRSLRVPLMASIKKGTVKP
jgi:hypothetical protein